MKSLALEFPNEEGQKLSSKLEILPDRHPHNYAIFAHCFTCSKNLNAIVQISRALTLIGFAVYRFDFTGLGQSEGSLGDTGFTSNVNNLVQTAKKI